MALLLQPLGCGAPTDDGALDQDGFATGEAVQFAERAAALVAAVPAKTPVAGILDGTLAGAKEFAATGAILYSTGHGNKNAAPIGAMICSGTLIAPDVVLAAGHCQENGIDGVGNNLQYYFSLNNDVSTFGPHVRAFPPDAVRVAHFAPHPDYSVVRKSNAVHHVADLALLFLERPMPQVEPATVLPLHLRGLLRAGSEVTIVGYGRRNLHFLGAGDGGRKTHGKSTLHRVEAYELQVGLGPNDAYKCWGDSGGPTYLTLENTGPMHLVGVTSRAADLGGCRRGGIDTRVDAFRPWIEQSMAAACGTALRPACTAAWRTLPN